YFLLFLIQWQSSAFAEKRVRTLEAFFRISQSFMLITLPRLWIWMKNLINPPYNGPNPKAE
ncbi:hypothetical protein ACFQ1A_28980, partial [Massilia pinisoli]|uniref:hypothetical protein n=1 Tax=Massilia pinisoli TaxID=1772194 RepID=UPI00363EE64A